MPIELTKMIIYLTPIHLFINQVSTIGDHVEQFNFTCLYLLLRYSIYAKMQCNSAILSYTENKYFNVISTLCI